MIPGPGRSPAGGNGDPLQYSCLENPRDRGDEPGGLRSTGSQRFGQDWATNTFTFTLEGGVLGRRGQWASGLSQWPSAVLPNEETSHSECRSHPLGETLLWPGLLVLLDADAMRGQDWGEVARKKRRFCRWSGTPLRSGTATCPVICYRSRQGSSAGAPPADLEEEVQLDPGPRTVPPPSAAATSLGGRLKSHKEEIEVMVYNEIGFITGNQGSECRGSKWNLVKTTMDTTSTVLACYVLSRVSRVWLFATPWTIAHQAPLSTGFSRQEYWNELPFPLPGDLPDPGIEPGSVTSSALALSGRFSTTSTILEWLLKENKNKQKKSRK